MALVKGKANKLNITGQSLLTLSASSISPNAKPSNKSISLKDRMPLMNPQVSTDFTNLIGHEQLPSQRMNSEEQEKKRISRELHDGLGQLLTTMGLHVQHCLDGSSSDVPLSGNHRESLEALSSMVKQAITEVRTICSAIRPAILDDLGVLAAVSWQCRQISRICSKVDVVTDFDIDESQIPEAHKTVIYRIVQESLNNAVKYSQANVIRVSMVHSQDAIHLTILDNGIGFDLADIKNKLGLGLMSMRERAESVNGKMDMHAGVGQGVEIHLVFPVQKIALNG
ncbi:MAG: sensor histidine kinase [Candidatus Thiodiazotropha sp. (ex Lucinoma borealis)]|nr:sensor histidine kinase [Candidatus Thiodiazotropha sp. (ex Lucinoma borealis)]